MYTLVTKSRGIQFLTFKGHEQGEVNTSYGHSCAMMMDCMTERALESEYVVSLFRAPEVPAIFGAFCYDTVLDKGLDEQMPTKENLHSFTKDACPLTYKDLPFETLEVETNWHQKDFNTTSKIDLVEEKASGNAEDIIQLHRFDDLIDVRKGSLSPRTNICSCYVASADHFLKLKKNIKLK